jgi:maleate isomerase
MSDWRARIGFLVPSVTPTVEIEMVELAPKGVSVHFSRMKSSRTMGAFEPFEVRARSHLEHLDETVELLAGVKPDVIVLAHTATSYVLGKEGEEKLTREITQRTGIPFISALGSVIEALGALGARKVAVGTPYEEDLTVMGKRTVESYGLEVVNVQRLLDVKSIFEETPKRVYGLMRKADRPEAQALFISGVGLPTLEVLQALEDDIGKPVISSASAMMWNALRVIGVGAKVTGYGRLLREH